MTLPRFPDKVPGAFGALAFDFGTTAIGVAHGQSITGTAQALAPLPARDGIPDWEQVALLLNEWQPALLVVGIPYHLDDSESPIGARSEKFARRLHGRFGLPCYGMDERYSSVEAQSLLTGAQRGASVDSLAAQLILETWFAELKNLQRSRQP